MQYYENYWLILVKHQLTGSIKHRLDLLFHEGMNLVTASLNIMLRF